MGKIKELRLQKKITQKQAADYLGISLRSYITYENEQGKINSIKYDYIVKKLESLNPVDEEHGILTIEDITNTCQRILNDYPVKYCILFGSYAKQKAMESSDIDLLIASDVNGLQFYDMVERLREELHKKVDVLNLDQLKNNLELTGEILQDGIRIYG